MEESIKLGIMVPKNKTIKHRNKIKDNMIDNNRLLFCFKFVFPNSFLSNHFEGLCSKKARKIPNKNGDPIDKMN